MDSNLKKYIKTGILSGIIVGLIFGVIFSLTFNTFYSATYQKIISNSGGMDDKLVESTISLFKDLYDNIVNSMIYLPLLFLCVGVLLPVIIFKFNLRITYKKIFGFSFLIFAILLSVFILLYIHSNCYLYGISMLNCAEYTPIMTPLIKVLYIIPLSLSIIGESIYSLLIIGLCYSLVFSLSFSTLFYFLWKKFETKTKDSKIESFYNRIESKLRQM